MFGEIAGCVLLCETQTTIKPRPNNTISMQNILLYIQLLNVPTEIQKSKGAAMCLPGNLALTKFQDPHCF